MERDFLKAVAHTKKWEGGLSRNPNDSASVNPCPTPYNGKTGWHTNEGVTYAVWRKHMGKNRDQEFFEMSDENWLKFYMIYYKGVKGDSFKSDAIALFLTQIGWGSGTGKRPGETIQRALNSLGFNLKVDGKIGPATIAAANEANERELFDAMITFRVKFFQSIAKGKNAVFLKGWLNRLEDFRKTFRPDPVF